MKQFRTVFNFELKNLLKNKALIITTIITAIISLLVMTIPTITEWFEEDSIANINGEAEFVLVYENDQLEKELSTFLGEGKYISEKELTDAIEKKEIESGFVIQDYTRYKYITYDSLVDSTEQELFEQRLRAFNQIYLFDQENIDSEKVYDILNIPLEKMEIMLGKDSNSGLYIAFGVMFIMYVLILVYGGNVANSVAREKDSRTMELLITSTKPRILILGKVAAAGVTGVLQVLLILSFIIIGFLANKNHYPDRILEMIEGAITIDTVGIYLLFSILGYLLYLFIFASLGSLVSKVEDVNKTVAPINILFFIGYLAALTAMSTPDQSIIKITSFIPFFSVLTMPIRYMLTSVSPAAIVISTAIMMLTVLLFAAISIYIYQFGALNYGNRLNLKEVIKSFKRT